VAEQELQRAKLIELDSEFQVKDGGQVAKVQFNPDTLKVTYANQLAQQGAGGKAEGTGKQAQQQQKSGDQAGGASRQYVGSSTTKLALMLWFDVTGERGDAVDVTKLTKPLAYFIQPQAIGKDKQKLPPNVRFAWGSFFFDGTLDSLEESFEFFSRDGRPLRAQVGLSMSRQEIRLDFTTDAAAPVGGATPGRRPLTPAPAGATLPGLAAGAGAGFGIDVGAGWQAIAQANGIEDPLRLDPGQLVDLNLRVGL
jgi:Contractile injection system tube protein